jgi:hypothetical protein
MSGRITYMPKPLHPCDPPNPVGLPPMSVWECDDCGGDWLLIPPMRGGNPSVTWWSRNPGMPEAKPGPLARWLKKRRKR